MKRMICVLLSVLLIPVLLFSSCSLFRKGKIYLVGRADQSDTGLPYGMKKMGCFQFQIDWKTEDRYQGKTETIEWDGKIYNGTYSNTSRYSAEKGVRIDYTCPDRTVFTLRKSDGRLLSLYLCEGSDVKPDAPTIPDEERLQIANDYLKKIVEDPENYTLISDHATGLHMDMGSGDSIIYHFSRLISGIISGEIIEITIHKSGAFVGFDSNAMDQLKGKKLSGSVTEESLLKEFEETAEWLFEDSRNDFEITLELDQVPRIYLLDSNDFIALCSFHISSIRKATGEELTTFVSFVKFL